MFFQVEDDDFNEFEVWQGLANLYSGLSHWRDAEICLEKAGALKPFSSSILHTEGTNDHNYVFWSLLSYLINYQFAFFC